MYVFPENQARTTELMRTHGLKKLPGTECCNVHFVTMPSTQTMWPRNVDSNSLGLTLWNPNSPSKPICTSSPSWRYLGLTFLVASSRASAKGCRYSLGDCKSLSKEPHEVKKLERRNSATLMLHLYSFNEGQEKMVSVTFGQGLA